jgi:hypothetical protein
MDEVLKGGRRQDGHSGRKIDGRKLRECVVGLIHRRHAARKFMMELDLLLLFGLIHLRFVVRNLVLPLRR